VNSSPASAAPAVHPAHHKRWHRRLGHRLGHSLGTRLVALFVVLALAMAVVFLGGMQRALSGGWRDVVRPLVADYVDRLAADLGSPPRIERARALVDMLPLSIRIDGPQVQWDSHPQRRHEGWHRHEAGQGAGWWLLTRTTADGHRVTFGLGNTAWSGQPRVIGWVTLALLLLLTALAYAYVRNLLRPLKDIGDGAQRFGAGEFGAPIRVRRQDELGDLAAQVNAMASNLHRMLDAKRELLLAISHELRSPLTRARLNAELVDDSTASREPREALLRDLALMGTLIGDLLESERLADGAGHCALQLEATDLNTLVRDLLAGEFAGAPLQLELGALPELRLDRGRMRLLLRNLIDNALRHGAGAAQPSIISTSLDATGVRVGVRDFGPGVADEHLPRLAEAFYRTDSARQRTTGGVGLGLHLCRLIARAHGGELRIMNAQPGLRVEVTLPR
jgi:signal transduction histidine kinase